MAFEVKVPAVGESVQEGMVYQWHKNNGEFVEVDDVIVELETDKATVEIVAEVSGVITQKKNEGDTVNVGDVLAEIDTDAKGVAKPAAASAKKEEPAEAAAPTKVASSPATPTNIEDLSPAVAKIVAENKVDVSKITGTGRGGRITKEDVQSFMASGPVPAASSPTPTASIASPVSGNREVSRKPMSMLRRRVAERLLGAQHENAILTTFNEVNMGPIMALRKQYKEPFKEKHGVGLGFMSFFLKASLEALKTYPLVNGYIDGTDVVTHSYYDIGVAMSTPRGLMVPVIRDADGLSFSGIEGAIMDYAVKARAGKIAVDDLMGGTFTVTNGGTFGSLLSTPIINPPQSAILGMHKIQDRPMAVNGEVVICPMMYLALSYDHRIVDGKEAVGFLVKVKECIEDPARLLLEV